MVAQTNTNLPLQVEVSFEALLDVVDKLSIGQKMRLLDRLRMQAFRESWFRLSQEIQSPGFSEDEIIAEIKAARLEHHANRH
ncbi:MAG: hypothetical protein ACK4Q5_08000 [Saprospiraceae bacterium]